MTTFFLSLPHFHDHVLKMNKIQHSMGWLPDVWFAACLETISSPVDAAPDFSKC